MFLFCGWTLGVEVVNFRWLDYQQMHSETLRSASFVWHFSESKGDNSRSAANDVSGCDKLTATHGNRIVTA